MKQCNNEFRRRRNGFTLIELLVTVAISGVLVGLGVASYNSFNERQTLNLAVRGLKTNLWATEVKAIANKQPVPASSCTNFAGYRVTFENTTPAQYRIAVSCEEGEINPETITMPSNIQLTTGETFISFKPRTAGTNLTANLTLTYRYGDDGATQDVIITPTGEIK